MTNARQKGLAYVREVKEILQEKGHTVEGPGFGVAFFLGAMRPIHRDYFGVYDLLSCKDGFIEGHQVSTLTNKAIKVRALREKMMVGNVWCRVSKGNYRIFAVDWKGQEEELFPENI